MEVVDNMPELTPDDIRKLRLAAERYKRAVEMRYRATAVGDTVTLTASTGEFRDALRSLLHLGYPLVEVPKLYDEALAEMRGAGSAG